MLARFLIRDKGSGSVGRVGGLSQAPPVFAVFLPQVAAFPGFPHKEMQGLAGREGFHGDEIPRFFRNDVGGNQVDVAFG